MKAKIREINGESFGTFDVINALTRSFPEWKELVADSYFAAKPQQRSLMEKWAKEGYEIFDWSTGVGRERSMAESEAKRKGIDPSDIHEINIANYTLWFGKKVMELPPYIIWKMRIEKAEETL